MTPLRRGLLVLLAGALFGVFFGSRNAQIVGFVVAMLILCLGAMRLGLRPAAKGLEARFRSARKAVRVNGERRAPRPGARGSAVSDAGAALLP